MKLRTKLLLGVGILLLLMVVIMFIVPSYFIRKDVYHATSEIHDLLIKDRRELIESQERWLKDVFAYTKQNNDALLFMLYQEPLFSSKLTFSQKKGEAEVWNNLARVIGYDPSIGLVQAHSPDEKKTAVIVPGATFLNPIKTLSIGKELAFISFLSEGEGGIQRTFFGFPLPVHLQKEKGYIFYALIDPAKALEELAKVNEEIARLDSEKVEKLVAEANELALVEGEADKAFMWAIKVDMIRTLAPLIAEGFNAQMNGMTILPEGLARVDKTGNGYAILSAEAFKQEPVFDDAFYYKHHQPANPSPPLAKGTELVTVSQGIYQFAYIANTLLLDSTYLTIGVPLTVLARQLALSSNRIILAQVKDHFWLGYDGEGKKIAQKKIDQIIYGGLFDFKKKTLVFENQYYIFSLITTLLDGDLIFYDLHPIGGARSITKTLESLEKKLSGRISLQLSLISIATMLLVLLYIGRLGVTIIYPITKLAAATQDVASGRFGSVVLPEVGDRQDEVAILTRSFGDMVIGLQEREKIRGVLDKVVSKDVAEEILKKQIHLGGEDRVVTVLFSDIRDFTHLSSQLSPQKTIGMLNACMTKISQVIEGEGGVIDKYVGDEVMALFGAPATIKDHALRAVSSGMLIIETLKKWNLERIAAGEPPIEMGIGVHTGLVLVGNMGAEDRLNYTVVGSHVNLASRLCDVAKPNQLIISEATLAEPNVEASFFVKALSPINLKGISEPVQTYEVTGFKWS